MKPGSNKIAIGGLFAAVTVIILLLGSLIEIGTFAAPMLSGICTLLVLLSADERTALLEWLACSMLVLFLSPDKELALLYAVLFGWYPILKKRIDSLTSSVFRCAVKLIVFNVSVIITYVSLWAVLYGFDWSISGYGSGAFTCICLLFGNIVFILYDRVLSISELKYTKRRVKRQ